MSLKISLLDLTWNTGYITMGPGPRKTPVIISFVWLLPQHLTAQLPEHLLTDEPIAGCREKGAGGG